MDFKAALDILVEQIVSIVNKLLEAAPFDKTLTGIIRAAAKSTNSKAYDYDIEINGKIKKISSRMYLPVNAIVKVLVPKNQWEQAQIMVTDSYIADHFFKTIKLRPEIGTTPTVTTSLATVIPPFSTGIIQIGLIYDGSINASTYQTTISFVRNTANNASIFLQQVSATNPFTVSVSSGTTLNIKCPTTTSASSVIVSVTGSTG